MGGALPGPGGAGGAGGRGDPAMAELRGHLLLLAGFCGAVRASTYVLEALKGSRGGAAPPKA